MSFPEKKILVTGTAGLVGSHLIYSLLDNGYTLRALVNSASNDKNSLHDLVALYSNKSELLLKGVDFIEGNLNDVGTVEGALDGITHVFHCNEAIQPQNLSWNSYQKINAEGTANLVNASLAQGVKWFMHVSSALTLGANPDGLIDEDFFWKPGPSISGYALSKYSAEQEVWRGQEEGLSIVIVNPSCVIGPSCSMSEFTELLNSVKSGKRYFMQDINGYIGVWDLVHSMISLFNKQTTGRRFIISSENIETKQLLQLISNELTDHPSFWEIKSPYLQLYRLLDSLKRVFNRNNSSKIKQTILMNGANFRRYDNQRILTETALNFETIDAVIAKTIALQKQVG